MALENEGNTDLAFDTTALSTYGDRYGDIANELRVMAQKLDKCLLELEQSGWTTPAGSAFHQMVQTSWEENIEKYADLLDTLKVILKQASKEYDSLVTNYIEQTYL